MELKQLKRFLAIVEQGSYAKAAKSLGLTQQALSISIANLEQELSVKLLDRSPGGITRPSPYGRILIKHARAQVAALDRAVMELHALRDAKGGAVSIGVGESFAGEIIAVAVSRFHAARPDIKISLIEGYSEDLVERLRSGDIDFLAGGSGLETGKDDLVQETLYSRNDVVAARTEHPLAQRKDIKLADLADFTWLVPRSRPSDMEAILQAFLSESLDPPRQFIWTDAYMVGLYLMLANDYLIMTTPALIGHQQRSNLLTVLDIERPTVHRVASLSYLRNAPLSPAAEAMLEEVRNATPGEVAL